MSATTFGDQPIAGGKMQGTAAADNGHGPRDLFPCPPPFPHRGTVETGKVSRTVARRLQRHLHWESWCNEGVAALNDIYGVSFPKLVALTSAALVRASVHACLVLRASTLRWVHRRM